MSITRFFLSICMIGLYHLTLFPQQDNFKPASVEEKSVVKDTSRVNDLIALSIENIGIDPGISIDYATEAQVIAEEIGFDKGLALALKYHGMAYYVQADYFNTINLWIESLEVFKRIGDLNGQANMLNNIGAIYFNQGLDVKAIEYYLESLRAAEKVGNKLRILTALVNIGGVYSNKPETHNKALEYYHQALPLCLELNDPSAIGTATVNMGQIFLEAEKYDSALYYFQRSFEAFRTIESKDVAYTLNYIGAVYAGKKDYITALNYQKQALEIAKEKNAKLEMTHSLLGMAQTYEMMKDTASALKVFREAASIASEINANTQLAPILEGMSRSYATLSMYQKAYESRLFLEDVKDSLYNAENNKKIERMQFNYDLDQKQSEINLLVKDRELQELELDRQRIVRNALFGGILLIFIIAFVLYRNYRMKVRSNKLLGAQKQQIENLLLNILPVKVAEELQLFGFATPRYYKSATVLFTDFKGFSRIAEGLTPNELVSELNQFFIAFDGIVEKYNLEKIKTIGDAYMCAGGIPTENDIHPLAAVKAGFEMQAYMEEMNIKREKEGKQAWGLRIGIHTGPLVAGVVGRKKYAYDIWGSTVNISSRMESNGEAGRLNISSATFELIKEYYSCMYRGKINAKNIGDIDMYFVDGEIKQVDMEAIEQGK